MFERGQKTHVKTSGGVNIFCATNFDEQILQKDDTLVVFNYGLVCSNEHWKYQLPFFDNKGAKILLHDYRFHHKSTGTSRMEECSFSKITQDIKEVVDHFGAQKVFMLGHSMGVNITLEFAKIYPRQTAGMVLISGSVLPPHDVMFHSRFMAIILPHLLRFKKSFPHTFQAIWKTQHKNPIAREIVRRGGFNIERVDPHFVRTYMQKISELPAELFFQLMEEMKQHDILRHLEGVNTPALVVGGDRDHVVPNHLQDILMRHLPSAEMYIVKDGSHVPQVDFPDSLNERIYSFFQKVCRS